MSSLAHGDVLAWLSLPTASQSPQPSPSMSTVPCVPQTLHHVRLLWLDHLSLAPALCVQQTSAPSEPLCRDIL